MRGFAHLARPADEHHLARQVGLDLRLEIAGQADGGNRRRSWKISPRLKTLAGFLQPWLKSPGRADTGRGVPTGSARHFGHNRPRALDRPRHAEHPLRARLARAALSARESGCAARAVGDSGVRRRAAAGGDRRATAGRARRQRTAHRRLWRLHLECRGDHACSCAAEDGRTRSRRRARRAGGEPRGRRAAHLPARRLRRHRLGRRDLREARAGHIRGAAAFDQGPCRRAAAAGCDRAAVRRVPRRGSAPPLRLCRSVARLSVQVRVLPVGARQDGVAVSARAAAGGTGAAVRARRAPLQVRRPHVQPEGGDGARDPGVLSCAHRRAAGRCAVCALRADPRPSARAAARADRALSRGHAAVGDRHPDVRRRSAEAHRAPAGQRGRRGEPALAARAHERAPARRSDRRTFRARTSRVSRAASIASCGLRRTKSSSAS